MAAGVESIAGAKPMAADEIDSMMRLKRVKGDDG